MTENNGKLRWVLLKHSQNLKETLMEFDSQKEAEDMYAFYGGVLVDESGFEWELEVTQQVVYDN